MQSQENQEEQSESKQDSPLNNLKYRVAAQNLQVKRLEGHKSDVPISYFGFIPRQHSPRPHNPLMFYRCRPSRCVFILHVPQALGRKQNNNRARSMFCFCQMFLSGADFRTWGRETLGPAGTQSGVSTGLWWCRMLSRPARNAETLLFNIIYGFVLFLQN